jgi:hypothetical protein
LGGLAAADGPQQVVVGAFVVQRAVGGQLLATES